MNKFFFFLLFLFCFFTFYVNKLSAQKKHKFFVELSPSIQQSIKFSEKPNHNLKHSPNWGASFYFGYEHKVTNKISIQTALGGTLYSILYNSGNNIVKLNMPGLLVNGTSVKIFYRDDYNYSYDIVTMVNYYIDLHKYKKLKAGLGVKIFAIRDMLIRVKSYYVDDFYNPTVVYPFFKSNLDFVGGFKKPGFVFSASYPLSRVKDKFDLGVLVNIMPYPIANGDFTIENTYANSNGTTKLYGSSIGVDFRYNF